MTPDLQRFVDAQAAVYPAVVAELMQGRKRTHWVWFIFPQLAGLGRSSTAQYYALHDRAHARAYVAHPLLGARLRECVALVNQHRGSSARQILGTPDDLKLHSCLTLFQVVAPEEGGFAQALELFYSGLPDEATLRLLGEPA